MKFTKIKLSGLRDGNHAFQFSLDSRFLDEFSRAFFDLPVLSVKVGLLTSETMIKADIVIDGEVQLVCDRSLDTFQHPVHEKVVHFFKYGEEAKELSDELEIILKEQVFIDVDQLVYDTVSLSLPSKKLHPRFRTGEEENDEESAIVYSTENQLEETDSVQLADPRWEKLKEIKRQ